MKNVTNKNTMLLMNREPWEKRIDAVGFPSSKGPDPGRFAQGEAVSEASLLAVSDIEGNRTGARAGALSDARTAGRAESPRAQIADEEFYEVFSEIRLP